MKRESILISEDPTTKRVAVTKFTAPGDVPYFDCSIHFGQEGNDVTLQNCIIQDNAIVKCSPKDTYDFETGAIISLMRMCGREKVQAAYLKAFNESIVISTSVPKLKGRPFEDEYYRQVDEYDRIIKSGDKRAIAHFKNKNGYTMMKKEMDVVNEDKFKEEK